MSFSHRFDIRYGEVDLQGVVFNAHYLAYLDHTVDSWLRASDRDFEASGWEVMVKTCSLEWHRGAGLGDELDVDVSVSRWGNSSFDVTFRMCVGDDEVVTGVATYVGVTTDDHTPTPPPPQIKAHLSR